MYVHWMNCTVKTVRSLRRSKWISSLSTWMRQPGALGWKKLPWLANVQKVQNLYPRPSTSMPCHMFNLCKPLQNSFVFWHIPRGHCHDCFACYITEMYLWTCSLLQLHAIVSPTQQQGLVRESSWSSLELYSFPMECCTSCPLPQPSLGVVSDRDALWLHVYPHKAKKSWPCGTGVTTVSNSHSPISIGQDQGLNGPGLIKVKFLISLLDCLILKTQTVKCSGTWQNCTIIFLSMF